MQEFTNITTISNPFLSLFLIILCTTYTVDITFAGDTLLKTACSNTSYAANSSYEASVNVLFSSLATNATQGLGKTRFFNKTVVGYDHGSSYTVYGLYLCRGDDSNNDCKTCVPKAIESLQQECATRPVVATVWYVDCMVRYSNESIFGIMDPSPPLYMTNNHDNMTTNATGFNQIVGEVMQMLATDVAASTKRYGTREAVFTSFLTVYAEAQCTPDLSKTECQRCLTAANNYLPECCSSSKGARVLTPSCNAIYELYPFFELGPSPSSPALPLVPSPTIPSSLTTHTPRLPLASTGRRRKTASSVTIALVALVAILVVQVFVCIYLMWRRGRKRSGDAEVLLQNQNQMNQLPSFEYINGEDFLNVESLQYDLKVLQIATNMFSDENKLGEGGFGGVYKWLHGSGILAKW
ncbi:hypothetical protein SOVF_094330 isoform B [Spinacia oleracea]|nr:hypothetical protein SOVF_094330 isoform B [Spinacia oleracea]